MFAGKVLARDLLFAVTLFFLIKNVQDHCATTIPVRYQDQAVDHNQSDKSVNTQSDLSPVLTLKINIDDILDFTSEEQNFIRQYRTIKAQIRIFRRKLKTRLSDHEYAEKISERIRRIQKGLDGVYDDYFKLSPSNVILGPIGAASQVIRERQLRYEFLELVNKVGNALANWIAYLGRPITFKSHTTIDKALEANQQLLGYL